LSVTNGSGLLTDLHSHLVPGVDDGASTLEEALEGVSRLRDAGVREIATTPHLDGNLTLDPGRLEARLQEMEVGWSALEAGVELEFPELTLHRGYEVMLDVPNPDFSDPRVRLADTSYVLIEWPRLQVPPHTPGVLARLRDQGLRVVVAHPERYHGIDRELKLAAEWRRMGALLQVNYGSLVGRYGAEPRERALTFLERGWVDLLSSDFHGKPHLPLFMTRARELLSELEGEEQFDTLARVNTARVLRGEDTLPVQPLALKQGVWERVRSLFGGKRRAGGNRNGP